VAERAPDAKDFPGAPHRRVIDRLSNARKQFSIYERQNRDQLNKNNDGLRKSLFLLYQSPNLSNWRKHRKKDSEYLFNTHRLDNRGYRFAKAVIEQGMNRTYV
jgi:hypothetical protein